jgi:hypothetical protein
MTGAQPVVTEPRAKAQTDDVVQIVPGQGHPGSKIEAALMVQFLHYLQ